uniref:Uncharacterized protein n=1 Tax=Gopherus agassizii TaxID=38772 RepID=A0A452HP04_9SAUR
MITWAQSRFLQISLVLVFSIKLLSSTKISSPDCHFLQAKMNQSDLYLLCRMGGQFPLQCLNERTDFRFPMAILKPREKVNIVVTIHKILHETFNLFSKNLHAAWNTRYNSGNDVQQSTLNMKKYFQRIKNFLKRSTTSTVPGKEAPTRVILSTTQDPQTRKSWTPHHLGHWHSH